MINTKKKKAGKAIGAGGFGCVFRPALKCKSQKKRTDGISKLSTTYESNKEYENLKNLIKYLKKIPNYKKYFIASEISHCQPDNLTPDDFKNINVCSIIPNVSLEEFNKNINNFKILNMPDGGKDLNKILEKKNINFKKINILLVNLLKYAIIPMNTIGIIHNDIKSENILYKNNNLKIIDFGEYFINKNKVPDILKNRKILYNSPFSRILFGKLFITQINSYLKKLNLKTKSKTLQFQSLYRLIDKLYEIYVNKYNGAGHEFFLSEFVLKALLILDSKQYFSFLPTYITDSPKETLKVLIKLYCTHVVFKFSDFDKNKFEYEKYFKEVYSKNVDIYGFLTSYIDILFYNDNNSHIVSKMLLEFCFSTNYAAKPYNNNLLITYLQQL